MERSLLEIAQVVVGEGTDADREWFAGVDTSDVLGWVEGESALIGEANLSASVEAFVAAEQALHTVMTRRNAAIALALHSGAKAAQIGAALGTTPQNINRTARLLRIEDACRQSGLDLSPDKVERASGRIEDKVASILAGTDPTAPVKADKADKADKGDKGDKAEGEGEDGDSKSATEEAADAVAALVKSFTRSKSVVTVSASDHDALVRLAADAARLAAWAEGKARALDATVAA